MFNKKYLMKVPNLTDLKSGKMSVVDVCLKMDEKNWNKLTAAGYNPCMIRSQSSYRYPNKWVGSELLYSYFLLQDILRGNFFNELRYPFFCLIKKEVYNQTLNEKEQLAVNNTLGNMFEEVDTEDEVKAFQKTVIAFISNRPHVGKTETTQRLLRELEEDYSVSSLTIAEKIRELCYDIGINLDVGGSRFFDEYSKKDLLMKFDNEKIEFKTRDLICEFSFLMQKYYGNNIWGESAITRIEEAFSDIVIIDDLRRPAELEVLKNKFGSRLILVYLDKDKDEDTTKQVMEQLSDSAKKFENELSKAVADIQFTFNSDWSNLPDLFVLIKDKLNTL